MIHKIENINLDQIGEGNTSLTNIFDNSIQLNQNLVLNKNVVYNLNNYGGNLNSLQARSAITCPIGPVLTTRVVVILTKITKGNCFETLGDPGCLIETISWPG